MFRLGSKVCIALLHLLTLCNSAEVELFDSEGFEGYFYKSTCFQSCTNLPRYGQDKASSIKTDTCIVFYRDLDCAPTWSMRVPAGNYYNLRDFQRVASRLDNSIKSFHACNETVGGHITRVDLKTGVGEAGVIEAQLRDLCGCSNIPNYAAGKITSLNNHGNCVKLWSERDCRGGSVEILGGYGEDASDLSLVRFAGTTKSVSGCKDAEECIRLNSTVFKFNITSNLKRAAKLASEDSLQMTAKTIFRNNGSATVTQEYAAKKTLTEVFVTTRERTMTRMHKVDVTKTVETYQSDALFGWDIFRSTRLLSRAYSYSSSSTNETEVEREEFRQEEKREFAASQTIQIPGCSTYTVDSYISVMKDLPVEYEVYAYISGTRGMIVMDTEELKERVSEMEYVGDLNNYTIIAKGYGKITADFGVEAIIDGEGEIIDDCMIKTK